VRFVSSIIADTLTGISRVFGFMGVDLPSYAVLGQQKGRISLPSRMLELFYEQQTRTRLEERLRGVITPNAFTPSKPTPTLPRKPSNDSNFGMLTHSATPRRGNGQVADDFP